MPIRLICLDADDTLWHNETWFRRTFEAYAQLLAPFAPPEEVQRRLDAVEHRNVPAYGYGVKGFILSALEAAEEIAGNDLPPFAVRRILELGREILAHPIEPPPRAAEPLPHPA